VFYFHIYFILFLHDHIFLTQDPKLIPNLLFLKKQQFDDQFEIFKGLSIEKFYGIIVYDENAIDNWLVDYSVKNQDIEEVLHEISIDL
jgi:hypothetical protein